MWRRSTGTVSLAALVAIAAAGCTSNGGFLGTDYHPRGDITVSDASTGALLTTSATSPYEATTGFSVTLHETDFSGPYQVSMVKWNNYFNIPCFEPAKTTSTVYTFTIANANAPGVTTQNPCGVKGDVEEAQITDGDGHTVDFYMTLADTASLASGATRR